MGDPLSSTAKIKLANELEATVIAAWSLANDKRKPGGDAARPAPAPKPENGDRPVESPAK